MDAERHIEVGVDLDYSRQVHRSLEADIASALNFWGIDNELSTPDFILASFLVRELRSMGTMQTDLFRWKEDSD